MNWTLEEAISYYQRMGAPRDQNALINLLKEIQSKHDGCIPGYIICQVAEAYMVKESLLLAVVKRIPALRIDHQHVLELCSGTNCGKQVQLAAYAEKLHVDSHKAFTLKFSPCMRMCGKGPNIKWDGKIYNKADKSLLQRLLIEAKIDF